MTLNIAQTPAGTATRSHSVEGEHVPATAVVNALLNSHDVADGTTNAMSIKGTTGYVYNVSIFNAAAYNVFIKLYDVAGTPVPGTDAVVRTIAVVAGTSRDVDFPGGLKFTNGIGTAGTRGLADNDTQPTESGAYVQDVGYL